MTAARPDAHPLNVSSRLIFFDISTSRAAASPSANSVRDDDDERAGAITTSGWELCRRPRLSVMALIIPRYVCSSWPRIRLPSFVFHHLLSRTEGNPDMC